MPPPGRLCGSWPGCPCVIRSSVSPVRGGWAAGRSPDGQLSSPEPLLLRLALAQLGSLGPLPPSSVASGGQDYFTPCWKFRIFFLFPNQSLFEKRLCVSVWLTACLKPWVCVCMPLEECFCNNVVILPVIVAVIVFVSGGVFGLAVIGGEVGVRNAGCVCVFVCL